MSRIKLDVRFAVRLKCAHYKALLIGKTTGTFRLWPPRSEEPCECAEPDLNVRSVENEIERKVRSKP